MLDKTVNYVVKVLQKDPNWKRKLHLVKKIIYKNIDPFFVLVLILFHLNLIIRNIIEKSSF